MHNISSCSYFLSLLRFTPQKRGKKNLKLLSAGRSIFFLLGSYADWQSAYSKGEPRSLPFRLWQLRVAWLFLHARIFLHGFRVDGRSDLRRVRYLRVRRRG